MSITITQTVVKPKEDSLKLKSNHGPEWDSKMLQELETKGYTVVKGAIPPQRAKDYEDRVYKWLESFNKGFSKNDKDTWRVANLPAFDRCGVFNRHGVHHEQFVWDIRAEPGVIEAFAKIWGTEELLVSFDGINVSLPFVDDPIPAQVSAPWPPHVDQNPIRRGKYCVQGVVNLAPNGPNDGGFTILEYSLPLFLEFFDSHPESKPVNGWLLADGRPLSDSWPFGEQDIEWFKERGCKWKKIEADPGDLILWDSRCIHYGASATGDRPRVATYVCYKPAKDITPEKLEERKRCVADYSGTTHNPLEFKVTGTNARGPLTPDENQQPHEPAVLSDRAKKLAGVVPY
ncbi:uncharacterized protein L203_106042 [Cryptococcus depauperatus CBS 7841]|uniref:Uncharacterized protein n=1 Tax=Cryptococcus depauperatus CBS 7841 TaxID=1295531 RepID=A0A1E3IXP8_9TREE|nr:hypothetical protein L203_00748 [Cryptococcus depauperatus CBS 7841]